ncbi:efflux RND transporter permease subunit [Aquabacterium sp. OR-4]|uniref:efflux RND transporter permease subunit n=1 Tax=Aquabacterium sp. OR-4 TaxID=2978127 RepID=UPI0028C830F6|nr:efflux RND transporter permease subunit [Aquabacterium sp. OR-4]MDT7835043.1 efflux RND transporter permease subunit [Aquabacterium sp. OR-4]
MALNVSSWSIRHPTPGILLFVLLTLGGLLGFAAMRVQNFPDMDLATVTVGVAWPGASAAQLEAEVARPLENALATVQGIRHINATLGEGQASLKVEFRLEKPLQEALDEVRDAVTRARPDLPADLREPVIQKSSTSGEPILGYAVASQQLDEQALSWFIDQQLTQALLAVPGVGTVRRVGGVTRQIGVVLDPPRLLALNVAPAELSRLLRRVQQDAAGGRADLGGAEQPLRTQATAATAQALAALELPLADGRVLRLGQVARVSDGAAERRSAARLDGRPVVGFELSRARGADELAVAAGVQAALQALQARHPHIALAETLNTVVAVGENYHDSLSLLYEGAALAVLVVLLFLRDWRATAVAAVALPLSAIPSFALMHGLGFTLNTVSLLSLSLVVGVLVDDAIVEIENISRHLNMGKSPYQAAMEAADEIGLAVLATTFTLVAVFLPTAFMQGVVGRYFVQFGWTAAIAVLFSLLVARLLTPMMAAHLLRRPAAAVQHEPRWIGAGLRAVRWCLRHRGLTLGLALALLAGGLMLAARLPAGFMPADDEDRTQVRLSLPPGSTLHDSLHWAEQARQIAQRQPQVRSVYTVVGALQGDDDGAAAASVRQAVLTLRLTPRAQRPGLSQPQIEAQLRQALAVLPGLRVQVGQGGAGEQYTLLLTGDDAAALEQAAAAAARELRGMAGIGAVTSSASLVQPELVARLDPARAADLGITAADIADSLRVATVGDSSSALAQLTLGERRLPVLVRLDDAARRDLVTLGQLPVTGLRGSVPLHSVATLAMVGGASEISRRDRRRVVQLTVELNGQPLSEVAQAALALPSLRALPPGVQLDTAGDAEDMAELARGFGLAMLTGVVCIYAVLVLLFGSFVQPLTILVALLLSVPGAFVALALTGSDLSMPSMIGLIMLMGIAAKNSILLVDYAILARREQGLALTEAVIDACRKRAQPIVMTTLAMGAGMLPLALGWGGDPSFRAPMAIVVIGGLISSTLLSLLVVPVVIVALETLAQRLQRWSRRAPAPGSSQAGADRPINAG